MRCKLLPGPFPPFQINMHRKTHKEQQKQNGKTSFYGNPLGRGERWVRFDAGLPQGAALARVLAAPHLLAHGSLRHPVGIAAVQSKGNGGGARAGGVQPGTGGAQPLPVFWQHQIFLPTDDSAIQLA